MLSIQKILVATDFGEAAGAAVSHGLDLARHFDAQLFLLHVIADAGTSVTTFAAVDQRLEQAQADARRVLEGLVAAEDRVALRVQLATPVGWSPASGILEYAHFCHPDLLVIGTHGRRGLSHLLLGSVAEAVLRASPCPVLVIRPPLVASAPGGGDAAG